MTFLGKLTWVRCYAASPYDLMLHTYYCIRRQAGEKSASVTWSESILVLTSIHPNLWCRTPESLVPHTRIFGAEQAGGVVP
jgi:hypothetical protein